MKLDAAIKILVECAFESMAHLNVNANLYERHGAEYPAAVSASKRRYAIQDAIFTALDSIGLHIEYSEINDVALRPLKWSGPCPTCDSDVEISNIPRKNDIVNVICPECGYSFKLTIDLDSMTVRSLPYLEGKRIK
jgi:hypothetical protein